MTETRFGGEQHGLIGSPRGAHRPGHEIGEFPLDQDRLWAPWRLSYVQGSAEKPSPAGDVELDWQPDADYDCFICRAVAESRDRENLLVARRPAVVCILNRYPYSNGHLLIAPRLHKGKLNEIDDAEHLAAMRLITQMTGILGEQIRAEGFNVGLNLGRMAGAGLPGHLHWHVVPRWPGDVNFMPTTAGVRVIPQSLDELWQLLAQALAEDPSTTESSW
jgi:ATP adenylyltransferase